MIRTNLRRFLTVVWLATPTAYSAAQQAVTVSGHVTAGGGPLAGARVRIADLIPPIERPTDPPGRYSFVIPANNVRGQAVTIVAMMTGRRPRFGSRSATVT